MKSGEGPGGADAVAPGFRSHDHRRCVDTALAVAESHCAAQSLRLTPVRRRTLEILLHEHRALGAYEVLERLSEGGFGSHPPLAYRALDFLVANGFVHRVERLNAFVACSHPGATHTPAFMICRRCDSVAEAVASPARGTLGQAARAVGFRIERTVVEAEGVCPDCVDETDA